MGAARHVHSADGTSIGYRVFGAGDPIVLVHGGSTTSADWIPVLPHLRRRFAAVTLDRRGREGSADGVDYSIEREAEDILAVVEAVDARLLVAHSYGALCAMRVAEQTDRLRRLVLYEPPIATRGRLEDLEGLVAAGRLDTALEEFLRRVGAPDEQLDAIRSSSAWPVLRDAVRWLPRELRECAGWRAPEGPIDVPTLFILGGDTDNDIYLEGLDELQARFPRSGRAVVPGQKHIAHVFAPEAFAALVSDFCGDGPGRATP